MHKNFAKQKEYAFFLLMKNRDTRRAFETFLRKHLREMQQAKEQQAKKTPACRAHANYETMRNGHRYASNGEILPRDAPPQPNPDMRWSYRTEKWVPAEGYDFDEEWKYEKGVIEKLKEMHGRNGTEGGEAQK